MILIAFLVFLSGCGWGSGTIKRTPARSTAVISPKVEPSTAPIGKVENGWYSILYADDVLALEKHIFLEQMNGQEPVGRYVIHKKDSIVIYIQVMYSKIRK